MKLKISKSNAKCAEHLNSSICFSISECYAQKNTIYTHGIWRARIIGDENMKIQIHKTRTFDMVCENGKITRTERRRKTDK